MTETATEQAAIQAFGRQYDYDVSYLEQMLRESREAYQVFVAAQPMSLHREELPLDAHFIARIAAMQGEDCGACAQLNLRMALEAGIDKEILRTMVHDPRQLPAALHDVYQHTRDVSSNQPLDKDRAARIRQRYSEAAFVELAVVIAGSRIYPTAKRSLLQDQACTILSVDR